MIAPRSHQLLSLFALLFVACGGSGEGEAVAPTSQALQEIEPNDNALYADYIGELRPGDYVEIQGHVLECCSDPYDGFAFYAPEPVELIFTLVEANPSADLDFCIYDPTVESMVACWETDLHPEVGVFDFAGPGELHVVIGSYVGDSHYLLQIEARPLPPLMLASQAGPDVNRAPGEKAARRFRAYGGERVLEAEAAALPEQGLLLPGGLIGPSGR
jgi:hypothetical protein